MNTYDVLYNPLANNGQGERDAKRLNIIFSGNKLNFVDLTSIDLADFLQKGENDIIIAGGDGTLNRFANEIDCNELSKKIYFFSAGAGNDFLTDINITGTDKPVRIDQYLKNLPVATINGERRKFINGVGFGIDGYCYEVGDQMKAKNPYSKVNFTAIAIKGLLMNYQPKKATVTVDGAKYEFENVWIASTLKGKYYSAGMKMAPEQDRTGDDLTLVIIHAKSKMIALSTIPRVYDGTHVNSTDIVSIFKGKSIKVEYDAPSPLQLDGDTYLNVSEYSVEA